MKESALPTSRFRRSMPTDAFLSTSRRIGRRTIVFAEIAGIVVRGEQQAERVAADFARQLRGIVGIDDGPRVDRGNLRAKNVDAFKEEWPLLFKENWEALIGGDDQLV